MEGGEERRGEERLGGRKEGGRGRGEERKGEREEGREGGRKEGNLERRMGGFEASVIIISPALGRSRGILQPPSSSHTHT